MRKVLFDHCVPAPLRHIFGRRIQITTAAEAGLQDLVNSALEKTAHALGYEALLTIDTDFGKPEHIKDFHIPVFLVRASPSSRQPHLDDLMPSVEKSILERETPGVYVWDNYRGTILFSRSFAESQKLRREQTGAAPEN